MELFIIILAILFMGFLIESCLNDDEKKKCNCEACQIGEPGWLSEEYAKKYPDCERNIYNRKD